MDAARREDYRHVIKLAVRWGDMDSMGHVNNSRFITYSESGRLAYFEPLLGATTAPGGDQGIILANINCDFLQQIHYPADVEVGTRVTEIGRRSLRAEQGLFVDGRAVAQVQTVLVWFDYVAQETAPVPESARVFFREREGGQLRE